ncbi:MFS transporter [Glycomyces sp. NPDC048151]|uniref:MFS transporter n=1 Tax=Glycomyces sp. NPDC048151 TaxID=3364002 RepID=UPI0037158FD5
MNAAPATSSAVAPQTNRWSMVVAAGLILFMVNIDVFTVATVIPAITEDFRVSPAAAQWAVLGFTLPAIALVIPAGTWLANVGRRPALLLSVGGFAALGAAVALAPGIGWLIAARFLQGAFAAVTFVLLPLIAAESVAPALRGRAMGLVFAIGPVGGVAGPVLAGLLADQFGWRAAFLLNLPVAVAILAIAARQPRTAPLRAPDRSALPQTAYLLTAAAATLLATTLAVEADPVWLALSAIAVPPVIAWLRTGPGRDVRQLFTAARAPLLSLAAQSSVQLVIMLMLPFFLTRELHADETQVGLPGMVLAATMAATSLAAGWLTDTWGARPTAALGTAVMTAGAAALAFLDPEWTLTDILWRIAIVGIGIGLYASAQTAMTLAATPPHLVSTASGTLSLVRQSAVAAAPSLATLAWGLAGYSLTGMRGVLAGAAAIGLLGCLALAAARRPHRAHSRLSIH